MSSTTDDKLWVICPVCHKANPAGSHFCQHCWGAVIPGDTSLTSDELAALTLKRDSFVKRRKAIKLGIIGAGAVAVVIGAIISLVYFTDIIIKPVQGLNSSSRQNEWSMFRHDLDRTGATGSSTITPQGVLKWSVTTGLTIRSSPAVAGGTVFFGSEDAKAYALDAETGATVWSFETGSWVDSSPSVSGGLVYFGSNDGHLYALNTKTGSKVWDFKTTFPIRSAPAIAGNVIYVGGDDYNLYALNTANGAQLWDYDMSAPAQSPPVVSNGILYIGSADGYSYAFNPASGQRRLRFQTHYAVYSAPIVVDNTVYFLTTNGHLFAVDGTARTWLWEHEITPFWVQLYAMGIPGMPRPPSQSGFLWNVTLRGTVNGSPALAGNTMYFPLENKMMAFDLKTQKTLWSFKTDGTIRSSPAIANNVLYFGSDDSHVYAVDATTGKKLWDFATGGAVSSSPAVSDGVVYVGSEDGTFYAIK